MAVHAVEVGDLRCEYLKNPLGVDAAKPRLGWLIEDGERGQKQTAYQILVASTPEILAKDQGDLWDSGKVSSDRSIQVEYAGKPLGSRAACHWKVRVWDSEGEVSAWSEPAQWTMGFLKPGDWTAKWITHRNPASREIPHPWLRRTFDLTSDVKGARIYVNTPCIYELYINGQKVGDDALAPAYSVFNKRVLYNVRDVSSYLHKGRNSVVLWLAPSWYQRLRGHPENAPIVRAQLEIETADGPLRIGTDAEWRASESCITQIGSWVWNNFGGERYDARKEPKGWSLASFDDSSWAKALELPAQPIEATWQSIPLSRIDTPIPAKSVTPHKNKWIIDFGTNLTGWMRLRMHGLKPGQEVVMEYADMLDPKLTDKVSQNEDGFQTFNQRDVYVAGDSPEAVFQSRFNHHGFRYAIVSGLEKAPELADAEALMVRTDLEQAGAFRCSNDLLNRIHETTVQTSKTQTPHGVLGGGESREKEAYGDGGSFLTGTLYNFRSDAFFTKWLQDWLDGQRQDGFFGNTAPAVQPHGGGPSWGGQASELARRLYLYFADKAVIERSYAALRKYVDYIETNTKDDILQYYNGYNQKDPGTYDNIWQFLGDWNPPGKSPGENKFVFETMEQREFFNNCYRVLLWQDLANYAAALGNVEEQKRCEERLAVLRPLIHKTFFDPEKKTYRENRQAYLVIALQARIMPEELRPAIFKHLEDDIVVTQKGHLDCGLQGSALLLDLLAKENRPDLAALIMGQETYPGWGFLLKERKVTTWPESWSGWNSQIIQVVGTPGAWFYEGFAGIRPDPAQPGFKHFSIRPGIVDSVDWVECWHESPYGKIVSNWKRGSEKVTMEVTVPPNSTATVFVPAKDAAVVTESGKPAGEAEGVKFLRMEKNAAVYAVGSGNYQFQSQL